MATYDHNIQTVDAVLDLGSVSISPVTNQLAVAAAQGPDLAVDDEYERSR